MDKAFFVTNADLPGSVLSHGPYSSEEVALAAAQVLPSGNYAIYEAAAPKTFTLAPRTITFAPPN